MTFPDERQVDPLARYWNEVAAGGPARPEDLDPALAETVRRLQAIGASPTPDPAFAAKLWEDLMHQAHAAPLPRTRPRLLPVPSDSPNHRPPGAARPEAPPRRLSLARWWPRLEFVAIALLAVALVAGLAAMNGGLPDRLGGLIGQEEEPEDERSFGPVGGVVDIGAVPLDIVLQRVTLAPGARWESPAVFTLETLESGSLVMRADVPGAEEQRMRAGSGRSGATYSSALRNDQSEPAVLFQALIGLDVRNLAVPEGVAVEVLGTATVDTLPSGQAFASVEGVVLTPDDSREIDTGRDGLALIAVEDGTLALGGQAGRIEIDLAAAEDAADAVADPRRRPSTVPLASGDTALLQGGALLHLGNGGDEPVRALVLTVNPDAAQTQIITGGSESIVDAVYGTPPPGEPGPAAEIGPAGTPTADAAVLAPEDCDVAPRSADELRALAAAGPASTPADPEASTFRYEDELPEGTPLDAATLAELTEAERGFAACQNAGDPARILAYLTDDAVRDLLGEDPVVIEDLLAAPPEPLLPDERIGLFPLREARTLPDGRVAAIVDWGQVGFDGNLREVTESNFHVYERVDGRWLIAEEIPTGR